MLSGLRGTNRRPSARARILALVLALGLVATAAPLIVPVVRWLLDALASALF